MGVQQQLDKEQHIRSMLQDEYKQLQSGSAKSPQLNEADRHSRCRECLWVCITLILQELNKEGVPEAEISHRLRKDMNTVKSALVRPERDELLSRSRLLADTKWLLDEHLQGSKDARAFILGSPSKVLGPASEVG